MLVIAILKFNRHLEDCDKESKRMRSEDRISN